MKTREDPRHLHRIKIVKQLFAHSFKPLKTRAPELAAIIDALPEIDQKLALAAPAWPLDKVAKTDLAILRYSVYELSKPDHPPQKVIIDEAIEMAKEFGGEASPGFINGVLGTIVKEQA